VRFRCFPAGTATAFAESARRHGDYAMAGVAAAITVVDGVIERATASFVSVTDVPTVLDLTEALGGREPVDADLDAAAEAVRQHVEPEADIHASAEYRRMLAGELARRVLALAAGQAAGQPAGLAATTKGSTSR
jgi:carbon-monoxide dehydrogenase medium subunit